MSFADTGTFDPAIVILSFGISFLGAYLSLVICEQLRQSLIEDKAIFGYHVTISHRKKHLLYLFLMALSIGGIGIWSMHFIGMHAFKLHDKDSRRVRVRYNFPISIASFVTVVITTFFGVTIASYDNMFSKTKKEIIEEFIADSQKLSVSEIRKINARKILFTISTISLEKLLLGGFVTGSGVSIMHYVGMAGTIFNGEVLWNPGLVTLSVIIAIVAASIAFWIFFRLLSIFPHMEILRIASAFIMAIAVCGMHYTGMVAGSFKVHGESIVFKNKQEQEESMNDKSSFAGALVGANLMLWLMVFYALWNSRAVIKRQYKLIQQAECIIHKITDDKSTSTTNSSSSVNGGIPTKHSNNGYAMVNVVRTMAEAYMAKRNRGLEKRVSREGNSALEVLQQSNMGFFEYMLHMVFLVITCKWKKAWFAIRNEFDGSVDAGSRHSETSQAIRTKKGDEENLHDAPIDSESSFSCGDSFRTSYKDTSTSNRSVQDSRRVAPILEQTMIAGTTLSTTDKNSTIEMVSRFERYSYDRDEYPLETV